MNERTSKRVAKIAGRILRSLEHELPKNRIWYENINGDLFGLGFEEGTTIRIADLKALAASALTQAPDRKKR